MEKFTAPIIKALNTALTSLEIAPLTANELELPPDPKLGDFGVPCFKYAKALRLGPPQVAQKIASLVDLSASPEITVAAVGPYVNFTVAPKTLVRTILSEILGPTPYGTVAPGSRGSWVLEYSSPNVAKTLNIYHLRPTALGAALDRVGRYRGYRVISINHLGDWGKQYGMLTVAFERYKIPIDRDLTMEQLVDLYVHINADGVEDPSIEEQAKLAFVKLEQGDPRITQFWKKCCDISIREFERIYKRIGVKFDHIWGESYYKDQLAPLLADLKARGISAESEGAIIVPVTDDAGKELPPCIVQKSDGATIYATRDLAAAIYRYQQFQFDRMTYIVGGEQRLHFQQVFAVLRKMGFDWVSRCEHVPTGLYRFKDAKMSTRKGNFITLESVLDLARERVASLMQERADRNAAKAEAEGETPEAYVPNNAIIEAIAVGAVAFHDLKTDPARDVDFDVDAVVDFEGETGPYLQYAHTRCASILRKAAEKDLRPEANVDRASEKLTHEAELLLIKTLAQFPMHLERTLRHAKASQLASYLIDVTRVFGVFYKECRVLGDDPALSAARLALVEATRRIIEQGLILLGIPRPERM